MDLQNLFYIIGIIFMVVGIVAAFSVLFLVLYIRAQVVLLQMHIIRKVNAVVNPRSVALHFGNMALKTIKQLIAKRLVELPS